MQLILKPQIDGTSIFVFDTSMPLIKLNDISKETITPRISFRINPANNMNDYSTTSKSWYRQCI